MSIKTSAFEICGCGRSTGGRPFVHIHDANSGRNFAAISFEVEVCKDHVGQPQFIVKAIALLDGKTIPARLWLLQTADFNAAYDLKNTLCTLLGDPPSRYQMRHCTGELQFRRMEDD